MLKVSGSPISLTKSLVSSHIVYTGFLPTDYLHLESCVLNSKVLVGTACNPKDSFIIKPVSRMTANIMPTIHQNYYFKPSYKKPYFYIVGKINGTVTDSNPNPSQIEIQIWAGNDTIYKPETIYLNYIKYPKNIELTEEQLDEVEDDSQIMEFGNDVCYRIIDQIISLILESTNNPRVQSHAPINQSVANKK